MGFVFPAGLHGLTMDCETSGAMHGTHSDTMTEEHECPMAKQHQAHSSVMNDTDGEESGFVCACSQEVATVQSEAVVIQKQNEQILAVVKTIKEEHTSVSQAVQTYELLSDSYSSPPIYLTNESFLI